MFHSFLFPEGKNSVIVVSDYSLVLPRGQLCLGALSDACNCSHEFFVAPEQLREVGYPLYNTG